MRRRRRFKVTLWVTVEDAREAIRAAREQNPGPCRWDTSNAVHALCDPGSGWGLTIEDSDIEEVRKCT